MVGRWMEREIDSMEPIGALHSHQTNLYPPKNLRDSKPPSHAQFFEN